MRKESILEALTWDYIDVATLVALIGKDGLETEDWEAQEKDKVVEAIFGAVEEGSRPPYSIDVAIALGTIREAELRFEEKVQPKIAVQPTNTPPTAGGDITKVLKSMYQGQTTQAIGAVEALILATCLEHITFSVESEARTLLKTLSEIMSDSSMQHEDQVIFENLARAMVAVAKQIGAFSATKENR